MQGILQGWDWHLIYLKVLLLIYLSRANYILYRDHAGTNIQLVIEHRSVLLYRKLDQRSLGIRFQGKESDYLPVGILEH
jgi:hypothetical protein